MAPRALGAHAKPAFLGCPYGVPIMPVVAVVAARRHNVRRHRSMMLWLFAGALAIAGLFTFMPGHIMHAVVFGS
jgi:uncharacterized membrane protein